MKICGWVTATVTGITDKNIFFRVDESELFEDVKKFGDLIGHDLVIPKKNKFWKSELCKGSKYPVTFNKTEEEIIFTVDSEYVLLISRRDSAPVKLIGTGSKKDLYVLLRRSYTAVDIVYHVNIPFAQGFVKGTIGEIISKLKNHLPGDPETYLTHKDTDWYIVAPDGDLKETTMPILVSTVV